MSRGPQFAAETGVDSLISSPFGGMSFAPRWTWVFQNLFPIYLKL